MTRTPQTLLQLLLVLTVCLTAAATNLFDSDVDLPALPYAYDALEPVIDRRTMEVHHGAHHRAYTNNFNAALRTLRAEAEGYAAHLRRCVTVEDLLRTLSSAGLPESLSTAVRNQGGGYYNHMLWWRMMTSPQNHEAHPQPRGKLRDAIVSEFGSFEAFQGRFSQLAKAHFGSGWVWLYLAPTTNTHTADEAVHIDNLANQQQHGGTSGQLTLRIGSFPNQDPPLLDRSRVYPVLGIDVWEHAHYLKYENRRPEYVDAWWGVVNWEHVEQLYEEALQRDAQQ